MGKKIRNILKNKDVGAIGIGAMIVFIAMVLVAGIAASVLISTANKLEIRAMQTGDETRDEVSTGLAVVDVEAYKSGSVLTNMSITVRPRAGSDDIDLSETFVEISDSTTKHVLKYDHQGFKNKTEINGNLFTLSFYGFLDAQEFGIIVLEDADSSCSYTTPVINRGDKVMITINLERCFTTNSGLTERVDVWGMVQPEEGASAVFGFRTPISLAGDTVFDLY